MPEPNLNNESALALALHKFVMTAVIFGPVRPDENLHRHTQRAIKSHNAGRDFFTDITLHELNQPGAMRIEYSVTAPSPRASCNCAQTRQNRKADV